PLVIFMFTSLRFKRGEFDEYFKKIESEDFFSKERDTLLGTIEGLLFIGFKYDTSQKVVDPQSYDRMKKSIEVEVYNPSLRKPSEEKIDKSALKKYAEFLKADYILVGDLTKMGKWELKGMEDKGCEMDAAFLLYNRDKNDFIMKKVYSLNERLPEEGSSVKKLPRRLKENMFSFARSEPGYCFLKIMEKLTSEFQPAEEE
ncbi:MAG: hypothetical protein AB1546_01745, partial [bacterium]